MPFVINFFRKSMKNATAYAVILLVKFNEIVGKNYVSQFVLLCFDYIISYFISYYYKFSEI